MWWWWWWWWWLLSPLSFRSSWVVFCFVLFVFVFVFCFVAFFVLAPVGPEGWESFGSGEARERPPTSGSLLRHPIVIIASIAIVAIVREVVFVATEDRVEDVEAREVFVAPADSRMREAHQYVAALLHLQSLRLLATYAKEEEDRAFERPMATKSAE